MEIYSSDDPEEIIFRKEVLHCSGYMPEGQVFPIKKLGTIFCITQKYMGTRESYFIITAAPIERPFDETIGIKMPIKYLREVLDTIYNFTL